MKVGVGSLEGGGGTSQQIWKPLGKTSQKDPKGHLNVP
jgi:hypothetical protein